MQDHFERMISMLSDGSTASEGAAAGGFLEGRLIGLEKENLRVRLNGSIAGSDHPVSLGSALSNPYITTDYSEALLEVVTPALDSGTAALDFLLQAQRFIQQRLPDDEFIWDTSMPCVLDGVGNIRIGQYGDSHPGKMKSVYRQGLGLRYGKAMQTIAGIHFNLSWPDTFWKQWHSASGADLELQDFVTQGYFAMTRNLLRNGWLVPYLFGASPAICKTFMQGRPPLASMKVHNKTTYYEPFGTSLRMGDVGYQYDKESMADINVNYDSLNTYLTDLMRLTSTPHHPYQQLGLHDASGEYQQLNANLLQIENEYYSSVRPKQLCRNGESPMQAMHRRGILYLELRSVDVNIFEPAGMCASQVAFLEAFMLYAQLQDSQPISEAETAMITDNVTTVAHRGREPELQLQRPGGKVALTEWADELFDGVERVAELLDSGAVAANKGNPDKANYYANAVKEIRKRVHQPELTPSARILDEMLNGYPSFYEFAKDKSKKHAANRLAGPEDAHIKKLLLEQVEASLNATEKLEQQSDGSFANYLDKYFEQFEGEELGVYRTKKTAVS